MAEAAIQPIEQPFVPDSLKHPGLLAVRHEIDPSDMHASTELASAERHIDPDGSIAADANKITMGALEKVRFFVREKTEQTQETLQAIRKNPKRLLALGSIGAVAAVASPVVEAAVEKAPVVRHLDQTSDAQAVLHGTIPDVPSYESGEYQGDGGYPYANAAPGTVDDMGYPVEQCAAYARWRLIQAGVDSKRAISVTNLDAYRRRGEVVDRNPAVGSMALLVIEGNVSEHAMYVEAYDDETGDVWVSEWNNGGNRYSMRKAPANNYTLDGSGNFYYVHYELPAPSKENLPEGEETFEEEVKPAERFMGARYDKRSKDTIRLRQPIKKGTFIQSESGQYRLVFDTAGSGIKLWDTKGDYKVKWQKFLYGKKAQQLRIKPDKTASSARGRSTNARQNVLTLGTTKKDFVRIPIGNATRIVLKDDGTFSGYRGNSKTPVWEGASNPARIASVARAATRKANKANRTSSTKPSRR